MMQEKVVLKEKNNLKVEYVDKLCGIVFYSNSNIK